MRAARLLAPLLFVAACTGPRPAAVPAPAEADPAPAFERTINPFPVRDAGGEAYAFPFLGGLEVPRPQFVDADGDGDPDLFVQEETGSVMFFENTGTPDAPAFVWRTDKYRGLDVGEWYRFADLDADGDPDLLAEEPYSYIRLYRNVGTAGDAAFELVADTLRDAAGAPIFSDRQNIPNVTDLDCDARLDLFIGRLDGTIARYEAVDQVGDEVPRFRLVTERFEGIEIVAELNQPGSALQAPGPGPAPPGDEPAPRRHGANTLVFVDIDEDGDKDLFWGDFFEPGLLFFENVGSCARPAFRTTPVAFPPPEPLVTSGYNAPTFADLDGDGDLDLFVGVLGGAFNPTRTAQANFYYYEQIAPGRFDLRTRRFLGAVDVGTESLPTLADTDGDGDLDLYIANKVAPDRPSARVVRYENTGTAAAPDFVLADTLALVEAYHLAPTFGDLDGDGDLDLLVGTWNEGVAYYRNEGTDGAPRYALVDAAYLQLTRGSNATPTLGDLDGDGDLDLMVGETSGTLNLYRNEGTPAEARFELVSDAYEDLDLGRRSVPVLGDVDGDGDLDLLVGREADGLAYFRNDGTPVEARFVAAPEAHLPPVPQLATPTLGDLDGDGVPDLLVGGIRGGLVYFSGPVAR